MRLLPLLLITAGLAGCASNVTDEPVEPLMALSEAIYDVLPVEEVFVTASDGMRMHNAVYRPDVPEGTLVPVFINFSPYWGNTAEAGGDGFGQYLLEHLVPRGYAVVLAAVRGTGHSEGCFEVASDREVQDLYEVVDFFADQDWSNGKIAAGGKSYDSTTQNGMIAKMPHEALRGIFHVSGITDMYRYNYVNGVPYGNGLTFTPRYATQYSQNGDHPDGQIQQYADMACQEMAEHAVHGTGSAVTGLKSDYWIERDWTRYIGQSQWNGSIFFVHGLQDWNVKPDHILPWITELPDQIRLRGWLHQDTEQGSGGHVYPMRDDWNETFIQWLDFELKGIDNGFYDAPTWDIEGTDGLWREMDVWPPEHVEMMPDRHLLSTVDAEHVPDIVYFDIDNRTRITGAPLIDVEAIATPGHVLTATFTRQSADGDAWVGEAVLRAVYRNGADSPGVVAGPLTYRLEAYPMDVVLEAGDVLAIELGANARYSITTGQVDGVTYDVDSVRLLAPLASPDARLDQPVGTPCFAC